MSLIDVMMEECTMMDRSTVSDGMGGFDYVWTEGATFSAAIVKNSSIEARIAEKEGVTEVYTVTVPKGTVLNFHDVFKRNDDGAIFRVTSNISDSETPSVSTFQIGQVTAERWNLT